MELKLSHEGHVVSCIKKRIAHRRNRKVKLEYLLDNDSFAKKKESKTTTSPRKISSPTAPTDPSTLLGFKCPNLIYCPTVVTEHID
jgi:hypothetical protein